MRLTIKTTRETIAALGLSAQRNRWIGEWRIDYRLTDSRRTAGSAYFTEDDQDAIDTARAMAAWQPGTSGIPA